MIAPSRPGYSRTPLTSGRTPVQQADTLAALLDTLDLDQIAVLAMSGGGPAGYALAGTHPDRVSCLVQVESITLPATAPRLGRLGLRLTGVAGLAAWMIDRFPARMLTSLGAEPTTDPDLRAAQVALARGIVTTAIRGSGLRRIDGGGHTAFLFRPDLQHETVTWLQGHRDG